MIRIGAEVKPGDIHYQKGIRSYSEEKLLRAIFGDKAGDVKDASLKHPSLHGVVLDKKIVRKSVKTTQTYTRQGCFRALEMEYEVKFVELKTS
jgi:DNA-directed RNA polymerase subunit beta